MFSIALGELIEEVAIFYLGSILDPLSEGDDYCAMLLALGTFQRKMLVIR